MKFKNTHNNKLRVYIVAMLSMISLLTIFLLYIIANLGVFKDYQNKISELSRQQPKANTLVYESKGQKIADFFDQYQLYIPYHEIPEHLVDAIIAIEDRHFWKHSGYDLKAIIRAATVYIQVKLGFKDQSIQGASTITQQVVRHFFLTKEKSFKRKLSEIALAYKLEKTISKQKIFELYVNNMFLGNGSYGIAAAAHRFFSKRVQELNVSESALIAGLFQLPSKYNPSKYPEIARKRQRTVLLAMFNAKLLSAQQYQLALKDDYIIKEYQHLNSQYAPYFVDYIKQEAIKNLNINESKINNSGLKISTTLDLNLQKLAQEVINSQIFKIEQNITNKDVRPEAALLAVHVPSGNILAMVGGRDYQKSQFNRVTQALRSPGSLYKSFVVSAALERGFAWNHLFYVGPIAHDDYRPRTLQDEYLSESTLMRAYYRSINAPILELAQEIGIENVIEHAQKLGIESEQKNELGTAIGSSSTTMMELARAYLCYLNDGHKVRLSSIRQIQNAQNKIVYKPAQSREQVLDPTIASMMQNGMQQVLLRGTASSSYVLGLKGMGGKTGTSNDNRDNWFVGYSDKILTIVWVGSDENKALNGSMGANKAALPIWHEFMQKSLEFYPANSIPKNQRLVEVRIHDQYGTIESSDPKHYDPNSTWMRFIAGREPTTTQKKTALTIISSQKDFRSSIQ